MHLQIFFWVGRQNFTHPTMTATGTRLGFAVQSCGIFAFLQPCVCLAGVFKGISSIG